MPSVASEAAASFMTKSTIASDEAARTLALVLNVNIDSDTEMVARFCEDFRD
ncbi:hypothetical protein [Bradyrhizobium cenepequi]|uniref:hypothetical protein n=1 Tax=Bradyrhizobium cenepequi TaxID=2821403 RepID=UPI001CE2E2C6|nr:hypothetical protein [Bradyrhizobium cenepequi]MCA6108018.1 hypothetical protein [Bradyrhizobium cenepequi]